MENDAATFFDTDIPALLEWQFTAADAGHITAPVLYIGGTDSGPMFAQVRKLMMEWLPQAEEAVIRGADHSLAISHPAEIATALATFLQRHKIRSGLTS
jgi:pimeloyl-ACP methyl ester carboxylesterase